MGYDLKNRRADPFRSINHSFRIGIEQIGVIIRCRTSGLNLGMRGRQRFVMRNEERVDGSKTAEVRKGNHKHRPFEKLRDGELHPSRIATKMNLDRRKVNTLSARDN